MERILEACRATGARGRPPGLRVPLRERGLLPSAREQRHRVHRPQGEVDRGHGRQDRLEEARARGERQHDPGVHECDRDRRQGGGDRARDRLPGDDQGERGRRRQGPARRARRRRGARGLPELPQRGQGVVRRRSRVHREVHRGAAPHRDPGAGRRARQHRVPGRTRVLDPAPAPEGDRGGALAVSRRRDAQVDGRAGGRARARRRLPVGGDRRVRRRARPQLLLPRDEHAPAGRAPGDGARHGTRPGRADDPRRGRREARLLAAGDQARRLGDRVPDQRRGPVPRLPAVDRPAGEVHPAAGDRRDGARRHRRARGRRDPDVLRLDDRQADHARRRREATRSPGCAMR